MPYQPTYPYPYLDAIDVSLDNGNNFKYLINPKDRIIAYKIDILSTTSATPIYYVRGAIVGGTRKKYQKIGSNNETEITTIPTTDTVIPLQGSYSDESWLQVNIPKIAEITNSLDYKHRITLYETNPTIKITEGIVQTYTNLETSITLQSNSNIVAGMYIKCRNQLREILTWNPITKVATITAFTTGPVVANDIYEIYSNYIVSNDYYFKARTTPTLSIDIADNATITSSERKFITTYTQAENINISHFTYNLYLDGVLIDTTDEVVSTDISYTYEGFLSGKEYVLELIVVNDDKVETKLERTFTVSYSELKTLALPILTIDNYKTCIDIDFSDNANIYGILEGSQTETFKKFKNEETGLPPTGNNTNAISLSINQNLYWNTVNEIIPLNIPTDSTIYLHTHFHEGFSGTIIELIDEDNAVSTVRVRYDGTKFYWQIGNNAEESYDPYTGGVASAIQASGYTVDPTKLYVLNDDDVLNDTDILVYNDLPYDYWWNIIILPTEVQFVKGKKYSESVVV